jgi:hypothetical protein
LIVLIGHSLSNGSKWFQVVQIVMVYYLASR